MWPALLVKGGNFAFGEDRSSDVTHFIY